jgi:hypothetical protein
VKVTACFGAVGLRPDRAAILDEWIARAISSAVREHVQADGRIRRWVKLPRMENRFLRVVLPPDGGTIHNAFLDRQFEP